MFPLSSGASMQPSFLEHYNEARTIAQTNTSLRLLCSAFTDGLFTDHAFNCHAVNLRTGEETPLRNASDCIDFMYTRNPLDPIEIAIFEGADRTIIREPNEMWALIKPMAQLRMGDNFEESNWQTSQYSMLCSLNSETLSIAQQLEFKHTQAERSAHAGSTWQWLLDQKNQGFDTDALLLQISSFNGNPNHPFAKLRRKIRANQELSQEEIFQNFAEFGNPVALPLYALARNHAETRHANQADDYEAQIKNGYPHAYAAWVESLTTQGFNPDEYLPMPVHPLNESYMANQLHEAMAQGSVVKTGATIRAMPTISTRSLQPADPKAPVIKLTMPDIQLTGVARKLTPGAICTGAIMSDLIQCVLAEDSHINRSLRIVGEPGGIFFSPDGVTPYKDYTPAMREQSASLTALLRENPNQYVAGDEMAMPLAGCFHAVGYDADSGQLGKPLLVDIMRHAGVHDADTAKGYFQHYAHTVIEAQLGIFLRYGVALESHQQNSFNVFTADGQLRSRMVQDLADGAQIYRPVYEAVPELQQKVAHATRDLAPRNYAFNLTEDFEAPMSLLFSTTFKSNLFPAAAIIGKEFGISKTELLEIMRGEIVNELANARNRFNPSLPSQAQTSYQTFVDRVEDGLLHQPAMAKAFLTTLVSGNLSGYIDLVRQPNPFHRESATLSAA